MSNKVDLIMAHLEKRGSVRVNMHNESGVRSLTANNIAFGNIALAQHPGATIVRIKPF